MAEAVKKRKKKKRNAFVNYFKTFGLRQAAEIGILIASIVMFVGFFVTQVVQLVGVFIALAASLAGLARGLLIVLKNKQDKKNPSFKQGLSLLIFWSVFAIVALLGVILYFVI